MAAVIDIDLTSCYYFVRSFLPFGKVFNSSHDDDLAIDWSRRVIDIYLFWGEPKNLYSCPISAKRSRVCVIHVTWVGLMVAALDIFVGR